MRQLRRGPAPRKLAENYDRWTQEYRDSGATRPDPKRYGHKDVRRALGDISEHKCFYCERVLNPRDAGSDAEVEHRRGVIPHELGYLWSNLYLSCKDCNSAKKGRPEIAIETTLDPCDESVDPGDHIDAYNEFAIARGESASAKATIQKFSFNDGALLSARRHQLQEFMRLRGNRIFEQQQIRKLTPDDLVRIERSLAEEFAQPHMPFSWMFRAMLRRPGALVER